MAGAKVVHGKAYALGAQLVHLGDGVLHVLQHQGLGQLQLQAVRGRAGLLNLCDDLLGKIRLAELPRADVDRQLQAGAMRHLLPCGQLHAGLAQYPLAQRHDETAVLGSGNELAGRHHAALRMAPAQQRLHAHHLPRQGELGLVVQLELPLHQGGLQVGLQACSLVDLHLHLRVEEAQRIAALGLDLVHGDIGALEQLYRALAAITEQRGPHAAGAAVHLAVQHVGLRQGVQNLLAHVLHLPRGLRRVGRQLAQQDHELIAPETRHHVAAAHRRFEPLCNLLQQLVAHLMPARVVEHLEVVQVEEQQRPRVPRALHLLRGLAQPVEQHAAVGQTGERVVKRERLDLGAGAAQLRHVVVTDDAAALGRGALGHLHIHARGQVLLEAAALGVVQQQHAPLHPFAALGIAGTGQLAARADLQCHLER